MKVPKPAAADAVPLDGIKKPNKESMIAGLAASDSKNNETRTRKNSNLDGQKKSPRRASIM